MILCGYGRGQLCDGSARGVTARLPELASWFFKIANRHFPASEGISYVGGKKEANVC